MKKLIIGLFLLTCTLFTYASKNVTKAPLANTAKVERLLQKDVVTLDHYDAAKINNLKESYKNLKDSYANLGVEIRITVTVTVYEDGSVEITIEIEVTIYD